MNIVIDIRPLMGGKVSGIEIYLRNLLENLFKLDQENTYILFANASEDQTRFFPQFNSSNVITVHTRIPNKLLNLALSFWRRPCLDKLIIHYLKKYPAFQSRNFTQNFNGKIDLFFMPDLRLSALSKGVKKITVAHDLSFEHFPQFFSWKTRLWYKILRARRELNSSDKIIAVSEFTKNDLIQAYQFDPQRIEVIYEGVEEHFGEGVTSEKLEKVRIKYHLSQKYLLFLSTLEPRKNIQRLIDAFLLFKQKNPQDQNKLVIAGLSNQKIFSMVQMKTNADIIFTGFVVEEDKAALIKGAIAFLYPSLFEGFGLPLLESMKCGTPIISSNSSSMPELLGDAALLIDPQKTEMIAQALETIQKLEVRAQLQGKMIQQIKKFSWKKCAEQTLKLFEEVVGIT